MLIPTSLEHLFFIQGFHSAQEVYYSSDYTVFLLARDEFPRLWLVEG